MAVILISLNSGVVADFPHETGGVNTDDSHHGWRHDAIVSRLMESQP